VILPVDDLDGHLRFFVKGHGAKFERKKKEAIAALLTQRNVDEAARAVGIDPNTLLRWLAENTRVPGGLPRSPPCRVQPTHRAAAASHDRGCEYFIEGDG
jgi:transposase-like protein